MDSYRARQAESVLSEFLAPLRPYFEAGDVAEVMVNRHDDVWIERQGEVVPCEETLGADAVRGAVGVLGQMDNKDVRPNTPEAIVDTKIGDMRVAAALEPTAVHGTAICVRKQARDRIPVAEYAEGMRHPMPGRQQANGLPDPNRDPEAFLNAVIHQEKNLLISGGTSSGKTTFADALLSQVDDAERVLILEDTPELGSPSANMVRLQANHQAGIHMRDLVRLSLRFRPDRIVVGEIRGREAFDLLQAMNTGHEGTVTTVHANDTAKALARLETLVLTSDVAWPLTAIRNEIGSSIDYIFQMAKRGGDRGIVEIARLDGFDGQDYRRHLLFQR